MEVKLEHFLHDLIWLIKEDYNESLDKVTASTSESESAFADGESVAYFHVLSTIANQLVAFDATEFFDDVAPEPGQKAKFHKAKFKNVRNNGLGKPEHN